MHIPNVFNPVFLEAGFEKHVKKKVIIKQNLEKNFQIDNSQNYGLRLSEKKVIEIFKNQVQVKLFAKYLEQLQNWAQELRNHE